MEFDSRYVSIRRDNARHPDVIVAMTAIMVYEMVRNYQAMGTPIAIKVCASLSYIYIYNLADNRSCFIASFQLHGTSFFHLN